MSMSPSFSPAYVVSLVLLPLSLVYLISFLRKRSTRNLPPGARGWPIIGESLAFSDTENFIKDRMEKYSPGEVFKTSLLGEQMAIFCGPQATKFLFTNENKLVSSWLPKSTRKLLFSPENVPKQVSASTPDIPKDIFKTEILKQYVPVMDSLARQHMDQDWTPNNVVKVVHLSRMYTFEVACRLFLRVVDHQQIKELLESFEPLSRGMYSIPIDFIGTDYNRGIKGGILVREKIMRIIKQRRKEVISETEKANDLLSKMLLGTDSSELAICNTMVGLLVGSFDATSSAITTVMNYLASLPHIYEEVLKEQMEIAKVKGPDELLAWEDIEKMKFSWNMARESLRLMSPGQGAFKEIMTEFTYAGFTIPKGWKAFWSVSSHKNPKYFPEPEKFDPSRFEGSGPAPYTFVPFGGGPRMCPGREFARLEILIFMHNVVRRFRLQKLFPGEKIVLKNSKPTPVYGLPVHLYRHEI